MQTINRLLVLIVRNSTRQIPATRARTEFPVVYQIHLLVIAIAPEGTGNTRERFSSCRAQVDTEVAGTDHRQGENEQTKSAVHCSFVYVDTDLHAHVPHFVRCVTCTLTPKDFGQKGIYAQKPNCKGANDLDEYQKCLSLWSQVGHQSSQSDCKSGINEFTVEYEKTKRAVHATEVLSNNFEI